MNDQDKPMPLKDLPAYLNSVRERGQGGYVPVVDVGRIVDDRPRGGLRRALAWASAACVLLGLGMYALSYTNEITMVSAEGPRKVSDMVTEGGGRVISVRQETDGRYRVRVFAFGGVGSLVERLKERKELEGVELDD